MTRTLASALAALSIIGLAASPALAAQTSKVRAPEAACQQVIDANGQKVDCATTGSVIKEDTNSRKGNTVYPPAPTSMGGGVWF